VTSCCRRTSSTQRILYLNFTEVLKGRDGWLKFSKEETSGGDQEPVSILATKVLS
jgi:hypothetical protein